MFLEAEASLEYLGLEAPRQRQSWGQPQGTLGLGLPLALGAEYKQQHSPISVVWWFRVGEKQTENYHSVFKVFVVYRFVLKDLCNWTQRYREQTMVAS